MGKHSPLISTDEVADRLGEPDLRLVDGSWHLNGRDGRRDFEAARLPGAVFFDLEVSSDQTSALPHMLPSPEAFARRMGALGLGVQDDIVVYDTIGVWSAARVWWMLRAMGATRVQVMDGGLPKWISEGRPLGAGPAPLPGPAQFEPTPRPEAVADMDHVASALAAGPQVVDARSADRFAGVAPEPRPGLRSGHMPGAINLPVARLIGANGTLKSKSELEAAFRDAGVDLDRPVITTCGSGVTAAILSLGLAVLGRSSRLYDGSWTEWGGREDTPVETG
ncbi:MAG TPA: 3-mercaptopyruvate sulfurtransferase [Brevundimonas sp.]|nr:3-mercaptopyruvate sulfurtransferase [Brevundimonas sp.]